MDHLHLDFETKSRVNLKKAGASRYSRDPSTEVLLLGYALNDEPAAVVRYAEGERAPRRLKEALRDPSVVKFAWKAPFEMSIFSNVLRVQIPAEQWRDVMVLAYSLSLPGSLDAAGKVVDIPEDKKKLSRGKHLVRKFTGPRKPTKAKPWEWCDHRTDPEEWEEFVAYCANDVEAERAIWKRLKRWDLPPHEWELWALDQRINEAGIPINMRVVRNAIEVAASVVRTRLAEMRRITGLENPNSNEQLLTWLRDNGYPFLDLKKGHVARALSDIEEQCVDPAAEAETRDYRRVLELRQEVSKSSVKKYNALAEATDDDGLLRQTFQFAGAGRTWRWAGRIYQPQNLAKPPAYLEPVLDVAVRHLERLDAESIELIYDKPMDLLSAGVRPVVQSGEEHLFADADLNAIENRVLGWLAGDRKILDVFRKGRDPYIDFSTYMFGGTYEQRWHEFKVEGNKKPRTTSKPAVLGCGYMLSPGEEKENPQTGEIEATGLLGYAWNMNVKLTAEESVRAVRVWRGTFTDVVEFWKEIDKAARRCIKTGDPQHAGKVSFDRSGPFMRMRLPSGRHLHYCRPRIERRTTPWGEVRPTITYEGLNDKNQWTRLTTHPGKLTENADQAIARDVLANGMSLAAARGLDIRLHVHDQVVVLSPRRLAEAELDVLKECMATPPKWGRDLPLAAAGFVSPIFVKD